MKGVSLPITAIVVVALSALVLVVMTGFFGGSVGSSQVEIQRDKAFQDSCFKLRSIYNCNSGKLDSAGTFYKEPGDDPDKNYYYCLEGCDTDVVPDGASPGLSGLCAIKGLTTNECLVTCGCPASTPDA